MEIYTKLDLNEQAKRERRIFAAGIQIGIIGGMFAAFIFVWVMIEFMP